MSSSHRRWVALLMLGASMPTLIVPIPAWHHHLAAPARDAHDGDPAGHAGCALCVLAPAITAELPAGPVVAELGPALTPVAELPVVIRTRSAPVACARAPPLSLLPAA